MTETTISIEVTTGSDLPLHPTDILSNLIVAFLAPMFLGVSAGDIGFARLAAIETVNAYQARNQADLVAIAQIIGFGLAALGSLSLSMADNLSLSMTLRLRGNAVALNRAAEQNRRVLKDNRGGNAMRHQPATAAARETPATLADDEELTEAEVIAGVAAAQKLAAEAQARMSAAEPPADPAPAPAEAASPVTAAPMTAAQRNQAMWATAMANVAEKYTAGLAHLPPAERKAASLRAAALTSTANALLSGTGAPPLKPGALSAIIRPNRI